MAADALDSHFVRNHVALNRPVLMKGAAAQLEAMAWADYRHLLQDLGKEVVQAAPVPYAKNMGLLGGTEAPLSPGSKTSKSLLHKNIPKVPTLWMMNTFLTSFNLQKIHYNRLSLGLAPTGRLRRVGSNAGVASFGQAFTGLRFLVGNHLCASMSFWSMRVLSRFLK